MPKSRRLLSIATLGPRGTCSEAAAYHRLRESGYPGEVGLWPSFEDAAERVVRGEAEEALVPAAYPRFNELVFKHAGGLRLGGSPFVLTTPEFVLARPQKTLPPTSLTRIAAHASPVPLLERLTIDHAVLAADSNAVAAWMAARGDADLALTNQTSVDAVNADSAVANGLEVIHRFGAVDMLWVSFLRA